MQARARPTPVFPEDGSTTVPPLESSPLARAASIMEIPIRSFIEPPGLRNSSLHKIKGFIPLANVDSLHKGRISDKGQNIRMIVQVI